MFSKEALKAISKGIREGHSVYHLELLGLPSRQAGMIAESGVITLEQLMYIRQERLLARRLILYLTDASVILWLLIYCKDPLIYQLCREQNVYFYIF